MSEGDDIMNRSLLRFKQLMKEIPEHLRQSLPEEVRSGAEMLASAMRKTVPTGDDGAHELRDSIRVEDGEHSLKFFVKAGGALTTHPVEKGKSRFYDRANAVEFGTEKMRATPFFWPTYRLLKRKVRGRVNSGAKRALKKKVKIS